MNRRELLTALGAGALTALLPRKASADMPDNVVLILCDDSNTRWPCYGDPLAIMPRINALAETSLRFDAFYAQFPLCRPSRANMFSGYRPATTGITDNSSTPALTLSLFPKLMRNQAGYYCWKSGKGLHYPADEVGQWDKDVKVKTGEAHDWTVAEHFESDIVTLPEPFLACVGFRSPHDPYTTDPQFLDLYPAPGWLPPYLAACASPANPPSAQQYDWIRGYYASLSKLDAVVGRVLDALSASDKSAYVILVSDNGYSLGEHGRWHKNPLQTEIVERLPLVISGPGIAPGADLYYREAIDLFATVMSLGGAPAASDGVSLLGPAKLQALAENGEGQRTVRWTLQGHRYRYSDGVPNKGQLYQLDTDPGECVNLRKVAAYASVVAIGDALIGGSQWKARKR